jgi:hypothetical protein
MLPRVIKAILVRVRSVPLSILEPDFLQSFVDRTCDDVHLRESAAEMYDTATAGNEEGHEDDMRRFDAVIKENSDGHEACCACTDLQARIRVKVRATKKNRGQRNENATCLCIEEEDPCVYSVVSFADAIR